MKKYEYDHKLIVSDNLISWPNTFVPTAAALIGLLSPINYGRSQLSNFS